MRARHSHRANNTEALLDGRLRGATRNIYNSPENTALIGLSSDVPNQHNPIQRIADPCPPGPTCPGELGDIVDSGGVIFDEEDAVITACRTAWRKNQPENTGIIAVNIRHFVGSSGGSPGTLGLAVMPYACNEIISANICRDPTLANPDDTAAVILTDSAFTSVSDDFLVAHEF